MWHNCIEQQRLRTAAELDKYTKDGQHNRVTIHDSMKSVLTIDEVELTYSQTVFVAASVSFRIYHLELSPPNVL